MVEGYYRQTKDGKIFKCNGVENQFVKTMYVLTPINFDGDIKKCHPDSIIRWVARETIVKIGEEQIFNPLKPNLKFNFIDKHIPLEYILL
jgi:hypothetical protein